MNVDRWESQAPWPHAQQYIKASTRRCITTPSATPEMLPAAPCPVCGRSATELSWFSVSDPESLGTPELVEWGG